ncbi:LuxR C-terminal-related transcriptional regulator [Georgenia yuyongxinii]
MSSSGRATPLSSSGRAATLRVAETTVKSHVTPVVAKLGVRDRVQAVVIVHRSGLAAGSR